MSISIAEYAARVQRCRRVFPDLESRYNDDEGLTLVWEYGGLRRVLVGEPEIVKECEDLARRALAQATEDFEKPVSAGSAKVVR